jgi:hypothetical protein
MLVMTQRSNKTNTNISHLNVEVWCEIAGSIIPGVPINPEVHSTTT